MLDHAPSQQTAVVCQHGVYPAQQPAQIGVVAGNAQHYQVKRPLRRVQPAVQQRWPGDTGIMSGIVIECIRKDSLSATLVTGPWAWASPSVSAPNWSSTTSTRGLSASRLPASASSNSSAASQARRPGSAPGRLSFRLPAVSGSTSADGTIESPVNGKTAILGQLLDRPDKALDNGLIGQEAVGHQPHLAPGGQMGGHLPKELFGHGGVGFHATVKRRIGDHRRPPALNTRQAIGGVDLTFRAGPGIGFPGTGNRLGLDIHTVYHTLGQALLAAVALQPAADHAGATGKVQHLVRFQRGLFQGFQQHPGAGIQLPFAEHTRQAGYVKAYAGTGNLRPAQPVG